MKQLILVLFFALTLALAAPKQQQVGSFTILTEEDPISDEFIAKVLTIAKDNSKLYLGLYCKGEAIEISIIHAEDAFQTAPKGQLELIWRFDKNPPDSAVLNVDKKGTFAYLPDEKEANFIRTLENSSQLVVRYTLLGVVRTYVFDLSGASDVIPMMKCVLPFDVAAYKVTNLDSLIADWKSKNSNGFALISNTKISSKVILVEQGNPCSNSMKSSLQTMFLMQSVAPEIQQLYGKCIKLRTQSGTILEAAIQTSVSDSLNQYISTGSEISVFMLLTMFNYFEGQPVLLINGYK